MKELLMRHSVIIINKSYLNLYLIPNKSIDNNRHTTDYFLIIFFCVLIKELFKFISDYPAVYRGFTHLILINNNKKKMFLKLNK